MFENQIAALLKLFERIVQQMNAPELALEFAHISSALKHALRTEREQLKKEITKDVLAQISVSVDTTKAVMEIEKLKKALHSI